MSIPMKLDAWMQSTGRRREDVAEELRVSVVSVGRYITGERIPRPEIIVRIKIMTGNAVTADDFLPPQKCAAA